MDADQLKRPLRFTPVYQNVVWGGRRLEAWRADLPAGPIGESWELSQQGRGMSMVAEGPLAGTRLDELMASAPEAIVGSGYDDAEFPLLIKIIDANDRLSVQVHPDDALAQELGVGQRGKTECWYLIGDGGELYQGTRAGCDRLRFEQALAEDTVADEVNRFETGDGDFFFMPARTVHALGRGCLLFEIQQSCDCTFRVYDWGRVGLDGKPRQLHVAESLRTIDFDQDEAGPATGDRRPHSAGGDERPLVDCAYFSVTERRLAAETVTGGGDEAAASIIMLIDGSGELQAGDDSLQLNAMQTALVPACAGTWRFDAAEDCRFLVARPRWH